MYLAISRSCRNKAFKLRENFDGFSESPDYAYVRKLAYFFSQFPQIKQDIFFKAPYVIYPDHEFFGLDYFTSQKAIRAYTLYMKQKQEQSPDSDDQLNFIKDSLRFICRFCLENHIKLNQYIEYKGSSVTYAWLKHVREHNISIYALMEFNISSVISTLMADEQDLFLGDLSKNFYTYKNRYLLSTIAKRLVKEGIQKVNNIIEESSKKVVDNTNK